MNTYRIKTLPGRENIRWEEIEKAEISNYGWVKSKHYDSFAKLVYIKDSGFICKMFCAEREPYAACTKDGGEVWKDSAMEFFFSFEDGKYINLETNSTGARVQEFSTYPRQCLKVFDKIPEGFKVTASREGVYWTLEIELPLEKLQVFFPSVDADKLIPGYEFTGNFYKVGVTKEEHYAMWNEVKTETPDFHRPDYFGKLVIE